MSSRDSGDSTNEPPDIDTVLMTLRKPTELKKVIDSVPKPDRAVPKNGLPLWYKLGLECKLPVPKMPVGKIVFARGKIGEDVRRIGLGSASAQPNFDLTDPYCNNVSYDYVPLHDPHLTHHFNQKSVKDRMKQLGLCTQDGRAVCSLKDFNQYRKYLYNKFMDRIHMEMKVIDERARDDLTLKQVENDVSRRLQIFSRAERAREQLERANKAHAEEWDMKMRQVKEQEKKIQARMVYLIEFNENQRKERAARAFEKQNRIKQRVQAAAEMELRRKITMVRQWRANEKRRLNRLKQDRENKQKRLEEEAEKKWKTRVSLQNQKLLQEAMLLKLYTEDMEAGAARRVKKAEVYAYNTDLKLQRIRIANLKLIHGGTTKAANLVKKMGMELERSKRGAKGMTPEIAQEFAAEAMVAAISVTGDRLMTLGQARARMDLKTVLPHAPINILDEIICGAIIEFARRRVNFLLHDIERMVYGRAALVFFQDRPGLPKKRKRPRWSVRVIDELTRHQANAGGREHPHFGEVKNIAAESFAEFDLKSVKDRPPTPVVSKTKLAEVSFADRLEDLPDPVTMPTYLPERRKLLEMVNAAARHLSRSVSQRVQKGLYLEVNKVVIPNVRHPMDWGEAVESLSDAVVNSRIHGECSDVRRASEFLTVRILKALRQEAIAEKKRRKSTMSATEDIEAEDRKDFYVPEAAK